MVIPRSAHLHDPNWGGAEDFIVTSTTEYRRYEAARIDVMPEFSGPWTVTVLPPSRQNNATGAPPWLPLSHPINNSYVTVRYGSGGALAEVDFDYRQGGSYTVWGSSVQVELRIQGDTTFGGIYAGVRAGAIVAPGASGAGAGYAKATRTVEYGDIAVGNNTLMPIPRFARVVAIQHKNLTFEKFLIQWVKDTGVTTRQISHYENGTTRNLMGEPCRVEVPSFATWLNIKNNSAVNPLGDVVAIYSLAL